MLAEGVHFSKAKSEKFFMDDEEDTSQAPRNKK